MPGASVAGFPANSRSVYRLHSSSVGMPSVLSKTASSIRARGETWIVNQIESPSGVIAW